MTTWGSFLKAKMKRQGLSIRALARSIEYANPSLAGAIAGRHKPGRRDLYLPPLDKQDAIADALALSDEERAELVFLAQVEHCPAVVRPLLLAARGGSGKERVAELLTEVQAARRAAEAWKARAEAAEKAMAGLLGGAQAVRKFCARAEAVRQALDQPTTGEGSPEALAWFDSITTKKRKKTR